MAAPTYATDLTDIFTDGSTTGWTALGGGAAGLNQETDYYIQGTSCLSKNAWASATKGMIYNFGSGITVPTDGAILYWITHTTPNSLAAIASGGIQCLVGSGSGDYYQYYVGGNDTIEFLGWILAAVDPAQTADTSTGSPTTTRQYFGGLAALPSGGPTKGAPFAIDAVRYGRCELRCTDGDGTSGYATFAGAQAYGDAVTRRWGLLSFKEGAYYQSGLFLFGLAATAVDFRDANRTIFLRDHPGVSANFNAFEVRNASSNVSLTGCTFIALGTQASGKWITTNDATVALTSCVFTDMSTFGFDSNTSALDTTFRRCGQVDAQGASLLGCVFDASSVAADAAALLWDTADDTDGLLDGASFTMGSNNSHAIELGTNVPSSITLNDVTYSGYNASDGQTDSTIYNNSGKAVTIYIDGGDTPSIKNGTGASTTIVANPVTVKLTVTEEDGTPIQSARAFVQTADGTGPFPYLDSVTISNSGTTATVTHTAHGMATNDKVCIRGASHQANNGVFTITVVNANSYTYTMASTPGSSPTGTITSSYVVLNGLTDVNGEISMSRVFSSAQNIAGWARKSSASPFFKTGNTSGTVSTTAGATLSALLLPDE